jgi:hypothetical protein
MLAACRARPWDTWQLRSCPEPEGGAGAQVTRDGPGAAPSWEAGAGAARTHGSPGAAPSREAGAGAVVLT